MWWIDAGGNARKVPWRIRIATKGQITLSIPWHRRRKLPWCGVSITRGHYWDWAVTVACVTYFASSCCENSLGILFKYVTSCIVTSWIALTIGHFTSWDPGEYIVLSWAKALWHSGYTSTIITDGRSVSSHTTRMQSGSKNANSHLVDCRIMSVCFWSIVSWHCNLLRCFVLLVFNGAFRENIVSAARYPMQAV